MPAAHAATLDHPISPVGDHLRGAGLGVQRLIEELARSLHLFTLLRRELISFLGFPRDPYFSR